MSNIEKLGWGKQKTVKEVVEYLTTNECTSLVVSPVRTSLTGLFFVVLFVF